MWKRYTFVPQNDQSDCGAAALATVALHYRRPIAVQKLRDLAGTDRRGTNLQGLLHAAAALGFSAQAVKGPYETLVDIPCPAIAHVTTQNGLGHFVVLHRVNKKTVIIADPAKGVQTLTGEQFCERWTGYLLLLVPDAVRLGTQTVARPVTPWQRFVQLLSHHTPILVEAFFCALFMTLLGIGASYFVQHLVDSVLVQGETRLLNALGIGMVTVFLFRTLFALLRQYLLAHVSRKVDLTLISGYMRHILTLPVQFFEMRQVGEILSRLNDAAKVRQAISGTALTAVVDGVMVVVSLTVLWFYDPPLALVSTAFAPLLLASVLAHHPAIKRRVRDVMEHDAQLAAHLVEDVSGVETVKAFGLERWRAEEGETRLLRLVQAVFSLQQHGLSLSSMGMFVTGMAGIIVLWYGGHRVIHGAISVGQLMFFYTLLGYLLGPLERLAGVNLQIQDAMVAIDRLYQVMDLEVEQSVQVRKATFAGVREAIRLENVSFTYGCRGQVLEKIDLHIPVGATVAIVGESGSGKSTLLKLLMRFYDPTTGRLLIDGVDCRDFDVASLRARIGLVSQEPFVFIGTIRENISLGRPGTTMDEIIEATRVAGLDAFVSGLADRFDTMIGERGANLSGGQRQRLAIARALVRNPDILLFDEATSHLDTATERSIQQSIQTSLAGRTVVLVAHRLSTIQDADLIYVLHQGQITEAGHHRQLMRQGGLYASLWRAQMHGGPDMAAPHLADNPAQLDVAMAHRTGRWQPCVQLT
jgi:ATP-binding cassette subfamily B protein